MDEGTASVPRAWLSCAAGGVAVGLYGVGSLTWVLIEDGFKGVRAWQVLIVVAAVAMFAAMSAFGVIVLMRRDSRSYGVLSLINSGAGLVAGASLFWIGTEAGWDPIRWLQLDRWWLILAMLLPLPLAAVTLLALLLARSPEPDAEPLHG